MNYCFYHAEGNDVIFFQKQSNLTSNTTGVYKLHRLTLFQWKSTPKITVKVIKFASSM